MADEWCDSVDCWIVGLKEMDKVEESADGFILVFCNRFHSTTLSFPWILEARTYSTSENRSSIGLIKKVSRVFFLFRIKKISRVSFLCLLFAGKKLLNSISKTEWRILNLLLTRWHPYLNWGRRIVERELGELHMVFDHELEQQFPACGYFQWWTVMVVLTRLMVMGNFSLSSIYHQNFSSI